MFGKKISKSQEEEKTPYTIHGLTTEKIELPKMIKSEDYDSSFWQRKLSGDCPYWQFISIDPAQKNLGFRIEKRFPDGHVEPLVYTRFGMLRSVKDKKKFGELPDEMGDDKNPSFSTIYARMIEFFDQFEEMYKDTLVVIIERQLAENHKTTRLSQVILTYFQLKLRNSPLKPFIVEIDPKIKCKELGCRGLDGKRIKKWSVEKAKQICFYRNEISSYDRIMQEKGKQDDLADTLCQVEAWCSLVGLPTTNVPYLEWSIIGERLIFNNDLTLENNLNNFEMKLPSVSETTQPDIQGTPKIPEALAKAKTQTKRVPKSIKSKEKTLEAKTLPKRVPKSKENSDSFRSEVPKSESKKKS